MKKEFIKLLKKILVSLITIPINIFIWACVLQCLSGNPELGVLFGCVSAGIMTGCFWSDIDNERW